MNRVYLPLLAAVAAFPLLWTSRTGPRRGPAIRGNSRASARTRPPRSACPATGRPSLVTPPSPLPPATTAQSEAAMCCANGQITMLGETSPAPDHASVARSASADWGGSIVGDRQLHHYAHRRGPISNADRQAVQWVNGVLTPLANPFGVRLVEAHAVSGDGSVIVGEASLAGPTEHLEAFRWFNGVATTLGRLANTDYSRTFGVSADGSVVVGDTHSLDGTGRDEAFRWANGVMAGLGSTPGNFGSTANAVSADGHVVVGQSYGAAGLPAFRWEDGVMSSIGDLGTGAESAGGLGRRLVNRRLGRRSRTRWPAPTP